MSDQHPHGPSVPAGRPPEIGATFGHYRIERQIGSGGMGAVYAATDTRLNRQVALKVVLGHYAMSSEFTERFHREAAILGRLDSPHVISVFDHGDVDGWPYIVAQYVGGGDLAALLRTHGALPRELAVGICEQVADALASAHEVGVVHRDVKPANVLLRDDRTDRPHVYLADFGVALTEATGLTTPGSVAGTWNYLSPERTRGDSGSVSSDVYAVGCVLFEALTGAPPYAGSDVEVALQHLQSPVPQLPGNDEFTRNVNHVLARCLAKDPGARYPDAVSLREDLRHLHASVQPGTNIGPGGGSSRRRGLALAAGAVVAAALVVAAVVVVVTQDDGTPADDTTPAASADDLVLGDVDGDGYGDALLASLDQGFLYRSDGTTLSPQPTDVTLVRRPLVTGRFGEDGGLGYAVLQGDPPNLSVSVVEGDTAGARSLLRTLQGGYTRNPDVVAADVDGDGLDDIVIRMNNKDESAVLVGLNQGDGSFAASETWSEEPFVDGGSLVAGDFDDDGDDDVVVASNGDFGADRPPSITMLISTGSAFETGPTSSFSGRSVGNALAGDVTGDGVPDLVLPDGSSIGVISFVDGAFTTPATWFTGDGAFVDGAALSDVDADGDADLLTLTGEELAVYLSDGDEFSVGNGWTAGIVAPEDTYIASGTASNVS